MVTIIGTNSPLPEGGIARGPRGLAGPTGPRGLPGEDGPQGLPGTNATPTDEAVAGYVSTTGTSATKAAVRAAARATAGTRATTIYPLNIPTHDGLAGVGHPDVLHIPGGWNGYEYWMGYTPLPGTARELIVVVASHDGVSWEVPGSPGAIPTPLVTYAELDTYYPGATTRWWSDTDLVLSPDGTTLMLYFRATATGTGATNDYWLATSTDGVTWSKQKIVTGGALESPAVVVEGDGTFTMFAVHAGNLTIEKRTSADGITWSGRTVATSRPTLPAPYGIWHMDVVKVGGIYHALVMGVTDNSRVDPHRTFHWISTDGQNWTGDTAPSVPLSGSRYDAMGNYRSTLQPAASGKAGKFDLWMSMIDDTRASNHTAAVWRIGLIRDFDFDDDNAATAGEGWTYPTVPPTWEADPLGGDVLIVPAGEIQAAAGLGAATRSAVSYLPTWQMAVDDYLVVGLGYLPRGWHRVAIDIGVISHVALTDADVTVSDSPVDQNSNPAVGFECSLGYFRTGAAAKTGSSGTVSMLMPTAAEEVRWLTTFDGSASTTDVRRDGLTGVRIRRRSFATTTYRDPAASSAVLPLHVVAVRFRRV